MVRTASPLRYPGGKSCLVPLVTDIFRNNGFERPSYVEPFAGGCGLALNLLFDGYVSEIHVNDLDASIWAFWHSVLERTDEFVYLVKKTPVTIREWHRQREIHLGMDECDPLALGFSTFYLNRTNRSGVIKEAGVIGGLDQSGPYKIGCRFNRSDLIERVTRVAKYKSRIYLTRSDALAFMKDAAKKLPTDAFFCIDPPYFSKGKGLYTSFYDPEDHKVLANFILQMKNPWIVTYDKAPQITKLYRMRRQYEFDVNYSIETKRRATEMMIASKGLRMPDSIRARQFNRPQHRAAA